MSRISRLIPIVGGTVAGGVVALAVASGGSTTTHSTTTVVAPQSASAIPTSLSGSTTHTGGMTVNQIYRQDSPGVVDIIVTQQSGGGQGFFGFGGGGQTPEGEGAGVVYDTKGDILTDEHVVSGATSVHVTFQDGYKASAKVLGTDPSTDVAVIRVSVPASQLHPIPLANSSDAQVGDPVVAIGSPFSLPETTTAGIVSQVGRSIQAPNGFAIPGAIQTDAAINPGNSGGPLLDSNGDVLGLNDQIQTNSGSSAGVGFAVPSNTVGQIANEIIAGEPVRHAYVGVELNPNSTGGAGVSSISSGSPAASAGIQINDLITAINGKAITSTEQFIATVDSFSPGQSITVTLKHDGQTKNIKLTLGTRPQNTTQSG